MPRQVADSLLEFADKWARLHVRMPKGLDEVSFSTRIDMQSELPKSSNQSINTLVDYSVSLSLDLVKGTHDLWVTQFNS